MLRVRSKSIRGEDQVIKIEGGTAKHGESLCETCSYASRREEEDGSRVVHCSYFCRFIYKKVLRCNRYRHANHPELYELKQIAWILTPGKPNIGFKRYGDLSSEEKAKISADLDE
jgi:hypothetical protein